MKPIASVATDQQEAFAQARSSGAATAFFLSWKDRLTAEFEQQIQALQVEHQERAFFATAHGGDYRTEDEISQGQEFRVQD